MVKRRETYEIAERLRRHYEATFAEHGATPAGIDWGNEQARVDLRYERMLDVLEPGLEGAPSVLDVGCGFGGLLGFAGERGLTLEYTGIDLSEGMIAHARKRYPEATFIAGDILADTDNDAGIGRHDYVICNGILTQKLDTSNRVMDRYAQALIVRLFNLCRRGVAFNVMSTKVNFTAPNLYYRCPSELLAWCMSEVTTRVRLDHAYPLYEYTLYLYREPQ